VDKLPRVLTHEPLVEAIFEIRFTGSPQLSDLLPGLLFSKLTPKPTLQRQPAADIPQPLRSSDERLAFTPLLRFDLERFSISIGDKNVIVSCKLPYPKWESFKEMIIYLTGIMNDLGIDGPVERYSLKYVNLIQAEGYAKQISKINVKMSVGGLNVVDNHFRLQLHDKQDDVLHIITLVTGAYGKRSDGRETPGVVVDIDSIRNIVSIPFKDFAGDLESNIESLRHSNKVRFFSCLKQETIDEMEPIYG
jgi:uncharacterized protein (TIGR04255 family)